MKYFWVLFYSYCSCGAVPATGDGRTYRALAVFGIAAAVVVLMLLLGKKSPKK